MDPRIHFDVFQICPIVSEIDLGLFFPNRPQSHAITSTNFGVSNSKIIFQLKKLLTNFTKITTVKYLGNPIFQMNIVDKNDKK